MRLLIIGASGLVGSALLNEAKNRGHEVQGTYLANNFNGLQKLDYGNTKEVNKIISDFSPGFILCPAGKVNVDWIEQNPGEAWNNNVSKLNVLFECGGRKDIPVAFYSSDYIFDGNSGPYSEDAIPNPINFYGKHKLVSEIMLKTFLPKEYLIIRTTWVFGQEKQGKNFLYSVIKNLSSGKEMKVPDDLNATPTYVKDVARCTLDLIEKGYTGTFNISSGHCISRLDFAKNIAKAFDLNSSLIIGVRYDTIQLPANRPLKAGLKNEKINKTINPTWTPLDIALKETRMEIEKAGQKIYELK